MAHRLKEKTRLSLLLGGDTTAGRRQVMIGELHRRYHRLVYYIFQMFELSTEDQDDLFNQVFLKIIQGLKRLKHLENLKSWVATITRNEVYRFLKVRKRDSYLYAEVIRDFSQISRDGVGASHTLQPDKQVYRNELQGAFDEALGNLKGSVRDPFVLRYVEGLSWKEIGTRLCLKVDTARKRASKARQLVIILLKRRFSITNHSGQRR